MISYEESAGTAIVYLEQSGGLVSQAPPPVPRRIEPAPDPAPRAVQPRSPAAVAASPAPADARSPRLAAREAADAQGTAGKR